MLNILRLDDKGTKEALTHPALAGKRKLARGKFSAVYDNGDTVLKVTTDSSCYELMKFYAQGNKRFPTTIRDFGVIGVQKLHDLNIYMVEVERLNKISTASIELRRLVRKICNQSADIMATKAPIFERHQAKIAMARIVPETLYQMSEDSDFTSDMREALEFIAQFSMDYDGIGLDFHSGNFMVRNNGELVFSDPVCNILLIEKANRRHVYE